MKLSGLPRWGVGIVLLVFVVGIALSNYWAGIYLVIGGAILIAFSLLVYFLGWKTIVMVIMIALVSWGTGSIIKFYPHSGTEFELEGMCLTKDEIKSVRLLTSYFAKIEAANFQEENFLVTEHVTFTTYNLTCTEEDDDEYDFVIRRNWSITGVQQDTRKDLPGRYIRGVESGLFLHEVVIPPLEDYKYNFTKVEIVLVDFPFNSFYDARHGDGLKYDEYLGSETITWQTSFEDEGFQFAYLPAPFYNLRVLVIPFIELSKYDNWVLAAFGFVISSIFFLVIKPNVFGYINEKVKKTFKKDDDTSARRPPKRRTNRNQ